MERKLLEFSLRERRWTWNETKIRSLDVTNNVLYFLTTRMASLSENIRVALKVVSCFGIKVSGSIVQWLESEPQYFNLGKWLNESIEEGCIMKTDNEFQFVHDKVS